MAAYCASAEHCRAEVVEKMQRWAMPCDAIGRVVERLEAEKYIDEERYCRAFVSDKYRMAKWGKLKIAQALCLKKISSSVYQPILNAIDDEEYIAILQGLLNSKRKSVYAADKYAQGNKLVRFALGRGFEMKDIRRCMEVMDENEMYG